MEEFLSSEKNFKWSTNSIQFIYTFFFIRKKFIRKWGSNGQNLKKILRESRGSISEMYCFYWPNIDIRRYCIENNKDGIQIQVHNINSETLNHFSQLISVKVKKNLRKSQAQFRDKLRKLRLRQIDGFFQKKHVI